MQLFYDQRDDPVHEARGSRILYWLDDLDARPLSEAQSHERGFLFAGARSRQDYEQLISGLPLIDDRAAARVPLLRLDSVLERLAASDHPVPTPRTWALPLDAPLPNDLAFPLFVRTATTSLKRGGEASRMTDVGQLQEEMALQRKLLGWDALILARQWHTFAIAGEGAHGPVPQEVRTWIVDGKPFAWSFHYSGVVSSPRGFPLASNALQSLQMLAQRVGSVFGSRLIAADFARERSGDWTFVEAGPGSCAGTTHEGVFKAVACRLRGEEYPFAPSDTSGLF